MSNLLARPVDQASSFGARFGTSCLISALPGFSAVLAAAGFLLKLASVLRGAQSMRYFLPRFAAIAALALPGTAGRAADTLDSLRGAYAESPMLCSAHWRNMSDPVAVISKEQGKWYYSDCNARSCGYRIVSHAIGRTGSVLRLKSTYFKGEPQEQLALALHGPPVERLTVKRVSKRRFVFTEAGRASATLVRCTEADIDAGIGLQTPDEEREGHAAGFPVYYALEIPAVCPRLVVDRDAAIKQIGLPDAARTEELKNIVAWDKANIKDYCDKVLGAFGAGGRVAPDLLHRVKAPR
jgi:hypothetical protein